MKFNTKVVHGGQKNVDPAYNAVMPPIYQTSTFVQSSPGEHKGFAYARSANPTRTALEKAIASLENGKYGMGFGSGIAAIDAVMKLLKPGDEVLTSTDIYGGTHRLFTQIYAELGIKFRFISMQEASNVKAFINQKTKLIWIETPTNPLLHLIDLQAVAQIAKKHSILLAVDNTFATPYLQQPLALGADIVMHSATKYLGGHSDVILGALVVNDSDLAEKLYFIQKASGAIPGPQDCFLVLRGIKTLHLRMQRHCENAKAIALFLKQHPAVGQVYWPGFKSHPNHHIAEEQMTDFGGMLAFTVAGNQKQQAMQVLRSLKIFSLAESLGGVESLVGHPASMTHASIPKEEREKMGIVETLIRLSLGIEDQEDLILDLKQALDNVGS